MNLQRLNSEQLLQIPGPLWEMREGIQGFRRDLQELRAEVKEIKGKQAAVFYIFENSDAQKEEEEELDEKEEDQERGTE